MEYKNFEEFLMDKCDCHTNNSPEGFERWEENLDIQELEDFAVEWGNLEYQRGKKEMVEQLKEDINANT